MSGASLEPKTGKTGTNRVSSNFGSLNSIWLVVLTILENISQWEGISHLLWKNKMFQTTNQPMVFSIKHHHGASPVPLVAPRSAMCHCIRSAVNGHDLSHVPYAPWSGKCGQLFHSACGFIVLIIIDLIKIIVSIVLSSFQYSSASNVNLPKW